MDEGASAVNDFAALRGMLKQRKVVPGEVCDLCATPVGATHSHVIELNARRILCSCRPCYLLFTHEGAAQGRYKAIPSRFLRIADFAVDEAAWDELQIPIGLAFFFVNSLENKMLAFYPGPAGATESQLPLETWQSIAAGYPQLATLAPDVEAILIHRPKAGGQQWCCIVPIDAAYELVGIIRTTWRGFDGGEVAWRRIDAFFNDVAAKSEGWTTAPITS